MSELISEKARIIPYGRQDISIADIEAIESVLRSDWLTQGPSVNRFEDLVAQYCCAEYAVAVSSATSALHLACMSLNLGSEDWLWTSPNTFVASANCGRYCGSKIDFVDIDPETYNMSVPALTEKLEQAARTGMLPKVLIPVHFAGQPCEMESIKQLAEQYGFFVIEDASHAIGGHYKGKPIGGCQFSDMTIFSFHPVKIITTGEGGMVLTNNKSLHEKLLRLRSHGITRDPALMVSLPDGPWDYQQLELGYNYRITDIQAALGSSQMERLDEFVARRRELVGSYIACLQNLPVTYQRKLPDAESAHHLFVIRVVASAPLNRLQLFERLRAARIGVNVHYIPVHLQPYYKGLGFKLGDFPASEKYYSETITLPLFFGLQDAEQSYVIEQLRRLLTI